MKKRYIILLITGHTADSKRMRDLYIWAVSVAMSSILAACHTAPPHAIQSLSTVADATSIEQTIDATTLAALDNNTVAIVATPYGKDSIVGHQVVMDYYYLQANNIDELKAAIENRRADNPERKHFMANTSTRVRWNWDGYGQETCDLHTLRLSYDIVVTFPRWDTPEHLPDADKTAWVKFINDLATHEMGHIQVAYEQLPRMEKRIQTADCLTADGHARGAMEELRQANYRYDDATWHGVLQGASFDTHTNNNQ